MKAWKWLTALAIVAAIFFAVFKSLAGKEKPDIRWVQVTRGTIERHAVGTGTIGPEFEVEVKPRISGIVSGVFKRMGEKVRVGEPLVKVKPNPTPFDSVVAKRSVEAAKLNEQRAIEIGAKVVKHSRYVVFQMAEVVVPRALFRQILERISRLRASTNLVGTG